MMGPQFEENPQQQNNEGEGLIFMAMKDLFRKLEIVKDLLSNPRNLIRRLQFDVPLLKSTTI